MSRGSLHNRHWCVCVCVCVAVGAVTDHGAGRQRREGQSNTGRSADVAHHRAAAAECSRRQPGADVDTLAAARSEAGRAATAQRSYVAHAQSGQVVSHGGITTETVT